MIEVLWTIYPLIGMLAITQSCHKDFVVLILESEKAYDRIDCLFLHKVMLRMVLSKVDQRVCVHRLWSVW